MKRDTIQFIKGSLFTLAVVFALATGGMFVYGATSNQNVTATFMQVSIYLNGTRFTPADSYGNTTLPLVYQGTTYLPLRSLANAVGIDVNWDSGTNTIYLGEVSSGDKNNDTASYEEEVLRLVNIERSKQGLAPLKTDAKLSEAAQVRATEIVTLFEHKRPDGTSPYTTLDGISYAYAGENIASGYPTPAAVVEGWMNSPGHKANILNKNYTHLGTGSVKDNGTMYWAQLFIGR